MPHLRLIAPEEATGLLREEYDAAVARAGKVFHIVSAMSLNPEVLRASMGLYRAIMFGPSELSRAERELLATVVSNANDCHYWTVAHASDLRDEGASPELADHAAHDWARAELEPRVRGLCELAVKLTRAPAELGQADVDELRGLGWSDAAIHDAIQVVAYFNYINRVAEAVGVEDEPEWTTSPL